MLYPFPPSSPLDLMPTRDIQQNILLKIYFYFFLFYIYSSYCTKVDYRQLAININTWKKVKHKSKREVRKEMKKEFNQKSMLRGWWYLSIKFSYDLSWEQSSHDLSIFQAFISWHCNHLNMQRRFILNPSPSIHLLWHVMGTLQMFWNKNHDQCLIFPRRIPTIQRSLTV